MSHVSHYLIYMMLLKLLNGILHKFLIFSSFWKKLCAWKFNRNFPSKLKGAITQPTLSASQIHHDFIINADKRDLNIIVIIYNKHFTCSRVKNKWKTFKRWKRKKLILIFSIQSQHITICVASIYSVLTKSSELRLNCVLSAWITNKSWGRYKCFSSITFQWLFSRFSLDFIHFHFSFSCN